MSTDQNTETQPDPTILTADEVAVINAARTVCAAYNERLRSAKWNHTVPDDRLDLWNLGRVAADAAQAEGQLFALLNHASNYLHFALDRTQIIDISHYTPTGRTIPSDQRLVPVA